MLTDDDFRYAGVDYAFTQISVGTNNALTVVFDKAIPAAIRSDGTLHVNSNTFRLATANFTTGNTVATWANTGLNWAVGQLTVQLKLTAPYWTGVDLYGGDMVHQADGYQYMDLDEGAYGQFWVKLDQAPTATVTITIGKLSTFGIDDFDAVDLIDPQTRTFTTSNWQTGQSVTLRAATDGDGADDRIIISASVSIASGADANDPYRNPARRNGFVLTVTDTTVGGG